MPNAHFDTHMKQPKCRRRRLTVLRVCFMCRVSHAFAQALCFKHLILFGYQWILYVYILYIKVESTTGYMWNHFPMVAYAMSPCLRSIISFRWNQADCFQIYLNCAFIALSWLVVWKRVRGWHIIYGHPHCLCARATVDCSCCLALSMCLLPS